jgi:uncharacterized repeat protein (TIGR01451 family)
MKKKMNNLAITAAFLLASGTAMGLGTEAGTDVDNTATVTYSVGGTTQAPVDSNTTTFKVDRLVNFTVVNDGDLNTVPGATGEVLEYTLNNASNFDADFSVAATDDTAGDDFDPSTISVFVESGATPGYQPAEDTELFVDELGADTSIKVYVVSDIPAGQADGDVATVNLEGTILEGGVAATQGAVLVETTGAEDAAVVDNVFNDAAGTATGDGVRDGKHSDSGDYIIETAVVAVTKSSVVISDPVNGTSNPKRIPGAVVEYTITITNTGSADATGLNVSDSLDGNTTYVAGTIVVDGTAEDDDAAGADEADPNGASFDGTSLVSAAIADVAATTGSKTVVFRVTVD